MVFCIVAEAFMNEQLEYGVKPEDNRYLQAIQELLIKYDCVYGDGNEPQELLTEIAQLSNRHSINIVELIIGERIIITDKTDEYGQFTIYAESGRPLRLLDGTTKVHLRRWC